MKIHIITLHNANNVGAFLQALSLQSVLRDQGHEVSFLTFTPKKVNKFKKVKKYLKIGNPFLLYFKYKSAKKYNAISNLLNIEKFDSDKKYGTVIIGSDEVWNIDSTSFVMIPQYYGENIKARVIISYAASANNMPIESLCKAGYDFSKFDCISVRDLQTKQLVYNTCGRTAEIVCDPTVLIDSFEKWIQDVTERNYILVYSYGLNECSVKRVREYARRQKKRLISVGTYNSWCDKNIVVDPIEFLSYLKNADAVITSTFHGTVLSSRMHKEFAVYAEGSNKILFYLQQMGLEKRNASVYSLDIVFKKAIDYGLVEDRFTEIREQSMEFLRHSLEEENEHRSN